MNGPLLVIRADASHSGGTGHIMRTLAIAQEWIRRGGRCTYLCSTLPEKMELRLQQEKCSIHRLSQKAASCQEADETSSFLAETRPYWLLIDSYPLTPAYQSWIQLPKRTKVASISDFGPEDFHAPELVIHSNLKAAADYSTLPETTKVLSGPKYILIRNEVKRRCLNPITKKASNVLLSMGGSDPKEASAQLCKHLIVSGLIDTLNVRVITGPAYPSDGEMHTMMHPNIEIIQSPLSMSEQYMWADTGVCSPSTTSLELAHYGLPFGLILTADNQTKVLKAMQEEQAAVFLADLRQSPEFTNINELLSGSKRLSIASNAARLVDGDGSKRVCDRMNLPDIHFRNAHLDDANDLWELTNDPDTRAASFNSDPIPWENHLAWFTNQLGNQNVVFLIVHANGKTLGVVRYNLNAETQGESIISIGLSPTHRGQGLAPIILNKSAAHFFALYPQQTITAWIKPENKASYISFVKANYQDYPSEHHQDRIRMRLTNKIS